jgi:ribosomal protein S6--L-glutamate ligase
VAGAIARIAAPGEFRTNVHQGGRPEPTRLDASTEAVAVRASRVLGLDYAGVDLLENEEGPVVLEVNGTPLFRGIYQATGRDMAIDIVEHVLARVNEKDSGGGNGKGVRDGGKGWEQGQHDRPGSGSEGWRAGWQEGR